MILLAFSMPKKIVNKISGIISTNVNNFYETNLKHSVTLIGEKNEGAIRAKNKDHNLHKPKDGVIIFF